jgi:hypothetical protein
MTPKPSPAVDPLTPAAPTLTEPMPTATGAAPEQQPVPRLRCIQRPTGEWFTIAAGNAPGKDTPDATDLWTEDEARTRLRALGVSPADIDEHLTTARAHPEVSGDELPLPDPVVGGPVTPSPSE